jgi:hypothetical protein
MLRGVCVEPVFSTALVHVWPREMMNRDALFERTIIESGIDQFFVIVVVVQVEVVHSEMSVVRDPLIEVALLEFHVGHDAD